MHIAGVFAAVALTVLAWSPAHAAPFNPPPGTEAACAACHGEVVKAWRGSHHAKSMQHASADTVLAKFDGQLLTHAGERTLFTRRGKKFLATTSTPGRGGAAEEFEVLYTFGARPLQQYLVETDPDRLQVLPWAWDTRPQSEGGQRWFHLYEADKVPPGDRLHWKSPLQNWNGMCADCHSTGLARNYKLSTDRFETSADTVNVSCASCHGDASGHMQAMKSGSKPGSFKDVIRFLDSRTSRFERSEGEATASNRAPDHNGREIEVCASCHSRRTPLTRKIDPARAFLDQFTPELLTEGLYYADGQVRDEVYVWGSFMQSKLAEAGVTCSNCHNAHTASLKHEGNTLCTSCHDPEVFDAPEHHRHELTSTGARCVNCHMPQTTFMGVDARRDHAFKVPRPDLSVTLRTPNACTACHDGMDNETAAANITDWHGAERPDASAAYTIAAARARDPAARSPLGQLIEDIDRPDILRATALGLVPLVADRNLTSLAAEHLGDIDPLIRIGAIRALTNLPAEERASRLASLLTDEFKAVRLEAASALQDVPLGLFASEHREPARSVKAERLESNTEIAWRGEGRLGRALIHQGTGDLAKAKAAYRAGIDIDPEFTPPYVNLADLMRAEGRDDEAINLIREGLEQAPDDAALEHALGLALVRGGKTEDAMPHLKRAAERARQNPRLAYVYAVALHSTGEGPEAREELKTALERHPHDPDLLTLALSFASEDKDADTSLRLARKLAEISPDDPNWQELIRRLRSE